MYVKQNMVDITTDFVVLGWVRLCLECIVYYSLQYNVICRVASLFHLLALLNAFGHGDTRFGTHSGQNSQSSKIKIKSGAKLV